MGPGAFKILSLFLALAALPQALAGPGCARRNYGKPDCVEKCKQGWGVAGHYMGNNKWGSVMNNTNSTDLDSIVAVACGLNQTATSDPGSTPTDGVPYISSSNPPANGYEPTPSVPNSGEPSYSPSSPPISPPTSPPTSPNPPPTSLPSSPSSSPPPPPPSPPPSTSSSSSSTPSQSPPPPTSTPGNAASPVPSPSPSPTPSTDPSSNSSSTPSVQSDTTTSSFESDALSVHNSYRAQHGASPLTWSDDLASTALTWVTKCVFQHSQGQYGENLAAGTGGDYTITDAINDWMSEASSYNPNNPVASHFTQVVWKSTTQVGCAVYTCPAGSIFDASYGSSQFIACEYNPPGNYDGEYSQNVQA